MKHISSFCVCFFFLFAQTSYAWIYPIKTVYKNNCTPTLQQSCVVELPIIEDADYGKYSADALYRKIYSTLRGSTYFGRWDIGAGSHQGVDIATLEGTPVYNVNDGLVVEASSQGARGNVIVIEHDWQGQKIYSVYAHLSRILVKKGDRITQGTKIALVGSTGNSTGPHLHFQLDINPDTNHPFWYTNCAGSISEIVNGGKCQDQMYKNTIDPILFLEKNGNILNGDNVDTTNIGGFAYISGVDLVLSGFVGGILTINNVASTQIYLPTTDQSGSVLEDPIQISYDDRYIDVFPRSLHVLAKDRNTLLIPRANGFSTIHITYQNHIIKHIPILISPTPTISRPSTTAIRTLNNSYQSGEWVILSAAKIRAQLPENTGSLSIIAQADTNTIFCENIRNQKQNLTSRLKSPCVGTNVLRIDISPKQTYIVFKKNSTLSGDMLFLTHEGSLVDIVQ